ncbi:MAG TPA: shikimate kinase [Chitinophagaceae bacterium]|nr:shikimate kinase [Chitinophagaceae bacterium]
MKIYLIGFMGSGKSYWGRQLSDKLGIPFFDLDEQITRRKNRSINQLFAEEGEEYFRELERDLLHELTEQEESFVMACGGGTPCYFNNIEYMNASGTTVWINTSIDTLFRRLLAEKENRPLIRDLREDQLKAYIVKKFSDRKIYYEQAGLMVDEEPIELDRLINYIFYA